MKIHAIDERDQRLLQAAADGRLDILQSHCPKTQVANARCDSGCSALHWAAGCNQVQVVQYLLLELHMPVDLPVTPKSKKPAYRTPLHYAARNGCLSTVQLLVQDYGANVNATAKHDVTPFHLSLFQCQLQTARYFVHQCNIDYLATNEFGCGAVHWLSIGRSSSSSSQPLLEMAIWLSTLPGIDWSVKQKQGHTALHKAAWSGHTDLVRYLHETHQLWDDTPDASGNWAANLAEMGGHLETADYIRRHCSVDRAKSCLILGISLEEASDPQRVRAAYLRRAKVVHPDRNNNIHGNPTRTTESSFDAAQKAYHHLTVENGIGKQHNPAHSLNLLLQAVPSLATNNRNDGVEPENTNHSDDDDDCFKARLIAVLHEYGHKGLDLSNLKKKWKQVWGHKVPFPDHSKLSLAKWMRRTVSDIVELRYAADGTCRAHIRQDTREQIVRAVQGGAGFAQSAGE